MRLKELVPGWMIMLIITACLGACNVIEGENSKNEYYYFPEKNVYFDPGRELFMFSLDSGKTWDSIAGNAIPPVLGDKKILHGNTYPVWVNNNDDLQQYNGKILNIINEESLKPVVKETKSSVAKNSRASKQTTSKTRKRPIKRFFEKLFGKKKKDD